MQECSVHSDMILYPLLSPIFTVITEVWPRANQAQVTNNSTVIIEAVLTLSYTAIIGIASFTAVAKNGQCKNNGI